MTCLAPFPPARRFMICRSSLLLGVGLGAALAGLQAEVGKPQELAPGIWFHEGDLARKGQCNNGWIVLRDQVLVIDANWPSAAQELVPKIRATTDRPIRYVFDTHHHGDHAYGNQVWLAQGATIVAHEGVLGEMRKFETGSFGGGPGRWEDEAKKREDVAKSKLALPTILFQKGMAFDDGRQRVELVHFGAGHSAGDGFAWLPNERILFTGDACVNGPYNYMGDGDTGEWVKSLNAARALGPKTICPGHGLLGGIELLDNQIEFLTTLRLEVRKLVRENRSPGEVKAAVAGLKATVQANERIANYVGQMFEAQVEKVFIESGGKPFATALILTPEVKAGLRAQAAGKPDRFAGFLKP